MTPDEPRDPPDDRAPDEPPSGPPPRPRSSPGASPWYAWFRRTAKLWGFLGFCVLVVVLFRHVVLPFVFAALLAYILAPLVAKMSHAPDGSTRIPRGLSIITIYIAILAFLSLFVISLLPRISEDVARLGSEAPSMYGRINEDYAPRLARWLEVKFPSLAAPRVEPEAAPPVADVPLPPNTQFVMTPLPDGRYAIALAPNGLKVDPTSGGGYTISPSEDAPTIDTEDRIRAFAGKVLLFLQAQLEDVLRVGRQLVAATIEVVFKFFLVLMIAAFILLDIDKFHGFLRGLIPDRFAGDYEVVVAGIDRGLSGVIRGQLLICLLNGVLTYIGMLIFDVKYSLVLALVVTLLSLIPIFGTILSTIPIVLAALVSGDASIDLMRGVFILAWILGINFLEANFFNPKIMGEAAKIHPVLVIFALLAGEHTAGLVGALLAVPVMSIIQVLFLFFRSKAWRGDSVTLTGA